MIHLHQLDNRPIFPSPHHALEEPNGLLAYGGDLSVKRLIEAYRHGIFPWFSEGEPILWWSPNPRGVLRLTDFHASKSLKKAIRKHDYTVTINHAFLDVINQCATIARRENGTWITEEMETAYYRLHAQGIAHSIEVWREQRIVGGLYGVVTGRTFCGESMFSLESNASKVAFYYLVEHMRKHRGAFIDCQMQTPHLASLGCTEVSRATFLSMLNDSHSHSFSHDVWQPSTIEVDL
ncbi:leucyl/phenylalanyl-tRNA--protein transferase [Aestuariibacter sp. AA17]|uniref:Leucyl/phenylalanyl-tRNA--protein transferase n=1 Tax=Fluctibacter corallii TaxID=2984329 RepID=A0ABT3A7G7_9ALTE|nr:leucyl/phenylalanyl-tRNA--protein transferase [Aestuariibacter sp. AA17]MCV2884266.1 leucyl/phenylalanyl-tRNA--protein transferase [Aestuariibacter sp. AA17]